MPTSAPAEQRVRSIREELLACDGQIARLVEQLRRDNEAISRLVEDRHRRRRELLATQERKLRALRGSEDAGETEETLSL
jgi:hypothetical protein